MPLEEPIVKKSTQVTIAEFQQDEGGTAGGDHASQKPSETESKKVVAPPSIRVGEADESDSDMRRIRLEDLNTDDEFHTASECTMRHSPRSSTYDSASECEARYSPWWDYDKKIDEGISKEKMVLAVGCPQLPAPEEVLKSSPSVPLGKIVHEVIETTHIRVEHSHKMGVKSFVLSSETVRDENSGGYSTTIEPVRILDATRTEKQEGREDYDELLKKLEECFRE